MHMPEHSLGAVLTMTCPPNWAPVLSWTTPEAQDKISRELVNNLNGKANAYTSVLAQFNLLVSV